MDARGTSMSCLPTFMAGFRLAIGSWYKTGVGRPQDTPEYPEHDEHRYSLLLHSCLRALASPIPTNGKTTMRMITTEPVER
ncbi:MAG: hypothetical protein L0210_05490 [Rhodospirillales bacterium]|nr:hypothetical protein [Rhodospirillales bacterium]